MGNSAAPSQGRRRGAAAGDAFCRSRETKCIALIGPFGSGKTKLLEALLARCRASGRSGSSADHAVNDHTVTGDTSPEARAHAMGVSLNIADANFLGETYTFIDCPGSLEFFHEGSAALDVVDAAVVVCEPDPKRIPALQVLLKTLEDRRIPYFIFLNKIDAFATPVRDIIPLLQTASAKPLVLRQIPIWENGIATGFVDLALQRAYVYREQAPSEIVETPAHLADRQLAARFALLEKLADYDDELLEQILSDMPPPQDKVFDDLTRDLAEGLISPVLLGSAMRGNGISRLLKALRHEAPAVSVTARRLRVENASSSAFIFKTVHTKAGGRLSFGRVLTGSLEDGAHVTGRDGRTERIAGLFSIRGEETSKRTTAQSGDTVALGRLDTVHAGETITTAKGGVVQIQPALPPGPVFAAGLGVTDRKDEVKLSSALAKLSEEDPSLGVEHNIETSQIVLLGQGEMHLRVALERLERKYGVTVSREARRIAYKETIKSETSVRGRHKKQSGGHGQFGDVQLTIAPSPRGAGNSFSQTVAGGAVPRQFFASVENGVHDYLLQGPLGFPVVDVAVKLTDGSAHAVDSSDMAFRQAGRLAMSEGMPRCQPVLLEPILAVEIFVPSEATARVNGIVSQRRGQVLGFDRRDGWHGWDAVSAHIPGAEMESLIIDIRSATAGVGSFISRFSHLNDASDRVRDQVLASRKQAAE